jgi:hypothetical protein
VKNQLIILAYLVLTLCNNISATSEQTQLYPFQDACLTSEERAVDLFTGLILEKKSFGV